MATQYSNKPIVTNGLVYALDFGNQKSYVSGSTSARSLLFSLETSSFLSVGTGPIPNLVSGLLEFNGNSTTGSMLVKPTNIDALGYGNKEYTIQTIVRPKGANLITYDTTLFAQGGGNPNYLTLGASTLGVSFGSYTPGIGEGGLGRTYTGLSQLTHVTFRHRSGSYDLFINGVPVTASLAVAGASSAGFSTPGLGGALSGGTFNGPVYTGSVGNFYVYNRSLSSDEIYSNYLIAASRYGLLTRPKPYSLDENAYLFLQTAGITDPIITSSINTFVLGLKSASLWDKMIAIYPFVGTGSVGVNLTGSHRWNLKEPSLVTYPLSFTGSWNGSVSGSTPSGSRTNITAGGITPSRQYPNYENTNAHLSILSYDTPISSSMLAGTGMTREVAVSTLAGDYGTPAAAYSVRKVRTAYSGALMDVRRSIDNVTSSIGYVSNGDLDTGSLLNFANAVGEFSPGNYSGLAAAYSLRKVSGSYTGSAIDVRRSDNVTSSIGFDASGNLNTGSLLSFAYTENKLLYSNTLNNAAWNNNFGRITITTASAIAPDGTNTGTLLSGSYQASPNSLALAQVAIGSTSLRYTSVLYVSQSTSDYVYLRPGDNTACVYRFSTGVFTNVGPRVATLTSESAANGWIKLTATTPANENYVNYYIGPTDNTSSLNYGNPISPGAVYVWGAQLNSGSTALPYIQTTTAATTSSYVTTYVTQWYDQSGNNRHATQSVSTQQPVIISSGSLVTLKGKPSIYFDSVDDAMLTPTLLNKPYAVILVAQQEVGSYIQRIINSPTRNSLIAITRVQETVAAAGDISSGSIGLVNTPYVVSLVNDTTSSQVYSNTVNKTTTFNNNDFGLMNFGASGVYNEPAQAFVSEVIAYTGSSQISSSRSLIENNINNYYSIYTSSNAGYVAKWYDQSGNNNHATQTTTTRQPQIVVSGAVETQTSLGTTRPAIKFDNSTGTGPYLTNTAISNAKSVFTVLRRRLGLTDYLFWIGGQASDDYHPGNGASPVWISSTWSSNPGVYNGLNKLNGALANLTTATQSDALVGISMVNTGTSNIRGIGVGNNSAQASRGWDGHFSELTIYTSDQTSNQSAVDYGINSYYNIYTQPTSSNWTTSSFAIYATTSSISASINNDIQSGITSAGPLGLITVSRTGSNSLTIARNGVTSSFAVPASGALSTGIYLGAINNNGLALANSPYNISFASIGTGLTGNETKTLNSLVRQLQVNLQRLPSTYTVSTYPNAIAAFSLRKLLTIYTGSAIEVRRSSDNATLSIGFNSYGNLDTVSLLSFVGTSSVNYGYVTQWYDQSGNNNHLSQSTAASQPLIVNSGAVVTAQTFQLRESTGPNGFNNNTLPAIYFNGRSLGINRTLYSTNQISYYTVFNLGLSENTSADGYSVMATNTEAGSSAWSWYTTGGGPSGYINMFQQAGSARREGFPSNMPKGGTVLYSGYHTGSAYTVYVNNVSKGTDTQQQFGSGSFLTVGAGNGYQFPGSIQEIVFYATGSTANNTGIQDSINTYYQIY